MKCSTVKKYLDLPRIFFFYKSSLFKAWNRTLSTGTFPKSYQKKSMFSKITAIPSNHNHTSQRKGIFFGFLSSQL